MQFLGYAISSLGPVIILLFCFERLFHRRAVSTPVLVLALIGAAILTTIQAQFVYGLEINSLFSILTFFALSFFYKESWYLRLFRAYIFFLIGLISEGSGWLFGRFFFSVDMNRVNESQYFLFMCVLGVFFNAFYTFIAFRIIKLFKQHTHQLRTFILFLIAVLIYSIITLLVTFTDTAYLIPALILCILLIGAIAGCLYLFNDQLRVQRERLQYRHLEELVQDQVKHYSALYQSNQQIATLRHDLKNILINVRSYIQLKEYEKLDTYIAQLKEKAQPSSLIDNGLPFIDAVLTAKMAGHEKIDFTLHIGTLNLQHIQQSQIAMLLAIALDNALDACAVSNDPFIDIHISQQGDIISLVILNAADLPVKSIGSKLLTTKPDKQEHGYGMQHMEHIAAQNHGMLVWTHENKQFRLSVLLQDLPAESH